MNKINCWFIGLTRLTPFVVTVYIGPVLIELMRHKKEYRPACKVGGKQIGLSVCAEILIKYIMHKREKLWECAAIAVRTPKGELAGWPKVPGLQENLTMFYNTVNTAIILSSCTSVASTEGHACPGSLWNSIREGVCIWDFGHTSICAHSFAKEGLV
jgi:hypothetical protein